MLSTSGLSSFLSRLVTPSIEPLVVLLEPTSTSTSTKFNKGPGGHPPAPPGALEHFQRGLGQPNGPNLPVCMAPILDNEFVLNHSKPYSSHVTGFQPEASVMVLRQQCTHSIQSLQQLVLCLALGFTPILLLDTLNQAETAERCLRAWNQALEELDR